MLPISNNKLRDARKYWKIAVPVGLKRRLYDTKVRAVDTTARSMSRS